MPIGHDEIDAVHAEFDQMLTVALACDDDSLARHIEALGEHLASHFAMEEALMARTGFPVKDCHADEHAAVLASARQVAPLVARGNLVVGRAFLQALSAWFPAHAAHLDSAVAAWVCKQQAGAKPLVFHRAGIR